MRCPGIHPIEDRTGRAFHLTRWVSCGGWQECSLIGSTSIHAFLHEPHRPCALALGRFKSARPDSPDVLGAGQERGFKSRRSTSPTHKQGVHQLSPVIRNQALAVQFGPPWVAGARLWIRGTSCVPTAATGLGDPPDCPGARLASSSNRQRPFRVQVGEAGSDE